MAADTFAFRGTFFHTPAYGQLEALRDAVVVIQDGKIARLGTSGDEAALMREFGLSEVRRLKASWNARTFCQPLVRLLSPVVSVRAGGSILCPGLY